MIGHLEGIVKSSSNNSLIVSVQGVGYRTLCPLPVVLSSVHNERISLYIHTHVREDQITLYGFLDEENLFLFEKLISVSGIGPKSALAMLSVHSPSSLSDAIERGDAETLAHTPGVGKKTAEKIIIELKGKVSHLVESSGDDTSLEARLALEALGYSSKEIHNALNGLDTTNKTTSALIKEALYKLQ